MISPRPIRIGIIEDHRIVRAALKLLLEREPDMEVVGEASDREGAFEVVAAEQPDLLLIGDQSGRHSMLEFLEDLQAGSGARSILLTAITCEDEIDRAIQVGVSGLVHKNEGPDVLIRAIRAVHRGEAWLSRPLMTRALTRLRAGRDFRERTDPERDKIARLTLREREIVALMAAGMHRREIAVKLCVSDGTIKNHLTSIFGKLEVSSQLTLVFYAQRNGLDAEPLRH